MLYDQIGKNYDSTRRADPYIASRLSYHLQLMPNKRYLDVACGSGNYTIALANMGAFMIGIDQSAVMIETAGKKNDKLTWRAGDVKCLPFPSGFFDGAVCTLAIHHFDDLEAAFMEVYRVIRDGRFVLFTSTRDQMRGYWLNKYFPNAIEASIAQMPDMNEVIDILKEVGFRNISTEIYEVSRDSEDWFLYSGKDRPEMYLNPHMRAGSSTFANLADPCEVVNGCLLLEEDIQTGQIWNVIKSYSHDKGDYLFIIANKDDCLPSI